MTVIGDLSNRFLRLQDLCKCFKISKISIKYMLLLLFCTTEFSGTWWSSFKAPQFNVPYITLSIFCAMAQCKQTRGLVPASYCKALIKESYFEGSPDSATSPMWFELYHKEWSKAIILWKIHITVRPPVTSLLFHCFAFHFHLAVLFYWDKILYIPGWPGTNHVAVYDLESLVHPNVWVTGLYQHA